MGSLSILPMRGIDAYRECPASTLQGHGVKAEYRSRSLRCEASVPFTGYSPAPLGGPIHLFRPCALMVSNDFASYGAADSSVRRKTYFSRALLTGSIEAQYIVQGAICTDI
jgi:hypothetical protein